MMYDLGKAKRTKMTQLFYFLLSSCIPKKKEVFGLWQNHWKSETNYSENIW